MTEMLKVPTGRVDAVLDTDTFNEIDDQFALAYMIKNGDRIDLKAVYAAPFFNRKSSGPADGMEKSYNEILKVLSLADRDDLTESVFRGSPEYLPDEQTPVISPAATDLAQRAMNYSEEHPLYVVAIGAITNVASALLINPEISHRIVIVWLGGAALHMPSMKEFNLSQDIAAARIVFGCGVPLVQLPCAGVVDAFRISGLELEYWLAGKNKLADYLAGNTIKLAESYAAGRPWTRVLWDVTAVAWLLNDGDRFMESYLEHAPIPEYDQYYSVDRRRHMYRYVYKINRDALMEHLINRLTQ